MRWSARREVRRWSKAGLAFCILYVATVMLCIYAANVLTDRKAPWFFMQLTVIPVGIPVLFVVGIAQVPMWLVQTFPLSWLLSYPAMWVVNLIVLYRLGRIFGRAGDAYQAAYWSDDGGAQSCKPNEDRP